MVAGCDCTVRWEPCREKVVADVLDGGPGGNDAGGEVQGAGEDYKARAAARSSSKSGSSEVS